MGRANDCTGFGFVGVGLEFLLGPPDGKKESDGGGSCDGWTSSTSTLVGASRRFGTGTSSSSSDSCMVGIVGSLPSDALEMARS
mmetsp:Transcript_31005/g.77350  ORF Transcript_31005/g.77350 Transcript_31005/m.77350 type:complete len:84 (+) Transcript_31005:535-786(+)